MSSSKLLAALVVISVLSTVVLHSAMGQVDNSELKKFSRQHPAAKYMGPAFGSVDASKINLLYGCRLGQGDTPEASAQSLIEDAGRLFVRKFGQLVPGVRSNGKVLQGIMYNDELQKHKYLTFRFEQELDGIKVHDSGASFVVLNEPGYPVVLASFKLKEVENVGSMIGSSKPVVTEGMRRNALSVLAVKPVARSVLDTAPAFPEMETSDPEFFIWAGTGIENVEAQLAVRFTASRGNPGLADEFESVRILASQRTSEILFVDVPDLRGASLETSDVSAIETAPDDNDPVLQFVSLNAPGNPVNGTVRGRATTTTETRHCPPSSVEEEVVLPWARVELLDAAGLVIPGEATFTDAAGNYSLPNKNGNAVTVRSYLAGKWFQVRDFSLPNKPNEASPCIDQPVAMVNDFLHNPVTSDPQQDLEHTANVSAYYHANLLRDFIFSYEPTIPEILNHEMGLGSNEPPSFLLNTNNGFAECGSGHYSTEPSISMNRENDTAGMECAGGALGDLIYHEYGHHLAGNNEAIGDTLGVLIGDDPILLAGAQIRNSVDSNCLNPDGDCSQGAQGRTAENNYTPAMFVVGTSGPCGLGGGHFAAQRYSGVVWHTQKALEAAGYTDYQEISATLLLGSFEFAGVVNGKELSTIYLTLDSPDGNPANAEHYDQIKEGFAQHLMFEDPADTSGAYPATSLNVISGGLVGGSIADVADSDDLYLEYNPGPVLNSNSPQSVVLDFEIELPCDASDDFTIVVESSVQSPFGIEQKIEILDYSNFDAVTRTFTPAFVEVYSGSATNSDEVISHQILQAERFQKSGSSSPTATVRVSWTKPGFTIVNPWPVAIDQVSITTND